MMTHALAQCIWTKGLIDIDFVFFCQAEPCTATGPSSELLPVFCFLILQSMLFMTITVFTNLTARRVSYHSRDLRSQIFWQLENSEF
jgi:hypothetical protein